jgi:hypothetical protein
LNDSLETARLGAGNELIKDSSAISMSARFG